MYIIRDTELWASRIEPAAVSRPRQRLLPRLPWWIACQLQARTQDVAQRAVLAAGHPGVIADFLRAGNRDRG